MENQMEEKMNAAEPAAEEIKIEESEPKKKSGKKDVKAELLSEIEKLKAEIAEKDDKYLRLMAEYDNFRRRSREEKSASYENAMSDTVSTLLPIIDNLERAASFDADGSVKEGLVMIMKTVESALTALGVEVCGKVGEKFDPNLHNAVMHDEDETLGENEIVEVYQKGYKKGNKIIRFAMVKTVN